MTNPTARREVINILRGLVDRCNYAIRQNEWVVGDAVITDLAIAEEFLANTRPDSGEAVACGWQVRLPGYGSWQYCTKELHEHVAKTGYYFDGTKGPKAESRELFTTHSPDLSPITALVDEMFDEASELA